LGDLAIVLAADSKFVFTPAASMGIMDSVLDLLPTGEVVTKTAVEDLPDEPLNLVLFVEVAAPSTAVHFNY
jgi:hypothetical protein